MKKTIYIILAILVIGGFIWSRSLAASHFIFQEESITPTISITEQPTTPTSVMNPTTHPQVVTTTECGGKRGLKCPPGFQCLKEKQGADMLGVCIK